MPRGKEVFSFEYDEDWLKSGPKLALDPALALYSGPQFAAGGDGNFGVFLDSCPDRWGRVLMTRREALRARQEGRKARPLFGLDYLLGVHDAQRMGGLRYRVGAGPFLDDDGDVTAPPWTSIRELEQASLELESDDIEASPRYEALLNLLFVPGSSLGGARPKASVLDVDQTLWLAKFPAKDDLHNTGAWELVAARLAHKAGVVAAEARAQRFSHPHHTFLTRRFDRDERGHRIHFASGMAMTGRTDGEGASYLDLVNVLVQHGAAPAADLEQLWRRIVFSMCISNVDDHLRNHGFLLTPAGWVLSPAYDVNPSATGNGHVLNIDESSNEQDLALAREVAPFFRVKTASAETIIKEVTSAVVTWPTEAAALGISRSQQQAMAHAFRLVDR